MKVRRGEGGGGSIRAECRWKAERDGRFEEIARNYVLRGKTRHANPGSFPSRDYECKSDESGQVEKVISLNLKCEYYMPRNISFYVLIHARAIISPSNTNSILYFIIKKNCVCALFFYICFL